MDEVMFNGWVATKENVAKQRDNKWYRFKLNLDLLLTGILQKRWRDIFYLTINVINNKKVYG